MCKKAKSSFVPSAFYKAIADVPFETYAQAGYRYIFLDIDNTLMTHGSMHADQVAKDTITRLKKANFTVYLFSNATHERLMTISKELAVDYVENPRKPSAKQLLAFMHEHKIDPSASLVVGDQLITDVWAANKASVKSIWLEPISQKELWHIRLKRKIEAYISKKYKFRHYFDLISLEKKPKIR